MNLLWFEEHVFLRNVWRKLGVLVLLVLAVTGIAFVLAGLVGGFHWRTLSELFATQVGALDLEPEATGTFWCRFLFHLFCVLAFGGLLVSILCTAVQMHENRVRAGLVRYGGLSGHYVVIGWSALTPVLVERLLAGDLDDDWHLRGGLPRRKKERKPRLLLYTASNVEQVRHELEDRLGEKKFRRVVFYHGGIDICSPSGRHGDDGKQNDCRRIKRIMGELGITFARQVFLLSDEADPWGRDVRILAFARMIASLFRGGNQPIGPMRESIGLSPVLPVFAELDARGSQDVVPKFPTSPVGDTGSDVSAGTIYFRPFSIHELWAARLFSPDMPKGIRPLLYRPVAPGDHVHLVIVGFTRMGAALAVQALRSCHVPARDPDNPETFVRTRITVIDRVPQKDVFMARYPHLDQIRDVKLEFMVADVASGKARNRIRRSAIDPHCLLTVAVCLEDSDSSLAIALNLPEEVYQWNKPDNAKGGPAFPHRAGWKQCGNNVWVRQDFASGFADALGNEDTRLAWVDTFGSPSDVLTPRSFVETGAMIRNRLYAEHKKSMKARSKAVEPTAPKWLADRFMEGDLSGKNFLPDSFVDFLKLEWTKRWANVHAEDAVAIFLSSLGYRAVPDESADFQDRLRNNIAKFPVVWADFEKLVAARGFGKDSFAEAEHRRWMADRTLAGLRQKREDEVRDDVFLIHHSFRPFKDIDTQDNDRNSVLAIPVCLALEGCRIEDASVG